MPDAGDPELGVAESIFCPAEMFEWKFLNFESSTEVESDFIRPTLLVAGAAVSPNRYRFLSSRLFLEAMPSVLDVLFSI